MPQNDYTDTVKVLSDENRQYLTGENVFAGNTYPYPSDEVYAQILETVVITTVDAVIVNEATGKVLLGKRSRKPHPDWWIFGGRMRPGQTWEEAARYNLSRELAINVRPEQLTFLQVYSLIWEEGAQGSGSHTTSITMTSHLDPEQLTAIEHDDEYECVRWVCPEEVVHASEGAYHPCLVQTLRDYIASR